jgi:hypothetical protein
VSARRALMAGLGALVVLVLPFSAIGAAKVDRMCAPLKGASSRTIHAEAAFESWCHLASPGGSWIPVLLIPPLISVAIVVVSRRRSVWTFFWAWLLPLALALAFIARGDDLNHYGYDNVGPVRDGLTVGQIPNF